MNGRDTIWSGIAPVHVDPRGCTSHILDIHGATGAAWLDRLPRTIADCAERWSLTVLPPFENLSYNYVTPAIRADATPLVLKAGVPGVGFLREAEALQRFNGEGMVRLLETDTAHGVMLLECLIPGTALSDQQEELQIIEATANILRRLWRPALDAPNLATVSEWANGLTTLRVHFDGGYGPFPHDLVDRADGFFQSCCSVEATPLLLHGDPHPGNILAAERESWLAIDPKGVTGSPLFDMATFLNSLSDRDPALLDGEKNVLLARRAAVVAERFDVERTLLIDWALALCVLTGWWSFEDHEQGWERPLALAASYGSIR